MSVLIMSLGAEPEKRRARKKAIPTAQTLPTRGGAKPSRYWRRTIVSVAFL
jgi:hypothetical protein